MVERGKWGEGGLATSRKRYLDILFSKDECVVFLCYVHTINFLGFPEKGFKNLENKNKKDQRYFQNFWNTSMTFTDANFCEIHPQQKMVGERKNNLRMGQLHLGFKKFFLNKIKL